MPLEPHGYYRKATGEGREAVTAAIFWLKTRAGWRETTVHQVKTHEDWLRELSDDDLDRGIARLGAAIEEQEAKAATRSPSESQDED